MIWASRAPQLAQFTRMEYNPVDAWKIGLEYNKYGAGLTKSNSIGTDYMNWFRNKISLKNIKEVIGNYSLTQTK